MKYSARPKNARDRSPKVKRSPHINFQKHHTAGHEYILTIPETQPVSIPDVQPTQTATGEPVTVIAKLQQPPRPSSVSAQPTSYVVVDDQQPGTSRQMIYNPPSVAPSQQEKTQHFWIIQLLWSYSQCASASADRHTTAIFTLST